MEGGELIFGNKNNIIIGYASMSIAGVDVGYTEGGVMLRKDVTYVDIEGDQASGIVKKHIALERYFLTTTLLEATLQNLQRVMQEREANLTVGSSLFFGGQDPTVTEYVVTVTGKGVNGKTRTYTFYRATPSENVEHPIGQRDAVSSVPLTFEVMKDSDNGDKIDYCAEA